MSLYDVTLEIILDVKEIFKLENKTRSIFVLCLKFMK